MRCRSLMTIMPVMILCVSGSASRTGAQEASAESQKASRGPRGEFDSWVPYRVALNSPFLITLRPIPEPGCSGKSPAQKRRDY
jgi:hypothetical protein